MEDIRLAAKRLLETDVFNDVLELIENNLILDFKHAKASDTEALVKTKLQLNALYALKTKFRALAQDIEMEEAKDGNRIK